ncbi:PLP-dependent aminotransferase family protein [Alteromonas sediminis]|nr:PLP-dependent aminotransferase family protein [Alteromonas sediminis]
MNEYKYQSLAKRLINKIEQGLLQSGDRLPSIRQLSSQYKLAKVSVQHALHYLEARGMVEARPRSGYYVTAVIRQTQPKLDSKFEDKPGLVEVPNIFHQIMSKGAAFDLCPLAPLHDHMPHTQFLHRFISRAQRQDSRRNAVYYSPPEGDLRLRKQIQNHYKTRNCALHEDQVCITSGCQNSLFIALMACCNPGDTIAIESPAFYGVLQIAQQLRLKVIEVSCSAITGLNADDLEKIIAKWPVKACVVTPSYATPTGACMPYHEKQKLADLAEKHNIYLIEDDIYGDLGFTLLPEPLKRFDRRGNVILCGSFSKSLSRDLRVGWISGGSLHDKVIHLKLVNQLSCGQAVQTGLASFLSEGHYRRHLNRYRQQLRQRRDNLVQALVQTFGSEVSYTVPEGGLALWVELPPNLDTHKMYLPLLAKGINITPGVLFSSQRRYLNYLRLSFAHTLDKHRKNALSTIKQHIDGLYMSPKSD